MTTTSRVGHAVAVDADESRERAETELPMDLEFDLPQELASGVRDADGAWQFIGRFAAASGRPLVNGDGCDEVELREAEIRLGLTLPESLRHLYRLMGRRDDLTSVQDRLLRPNQLRVDESGRVLVFRIENQNVAQWGVELATIEQADPPVVFKSDAVESSSTTSWQPFLGRLLLTCVEMVLSEWMLSGTAFHDNRELDDATVRVLEHRFSRLPFPDYPLWAVPFGPPMRWFCGMGAVLRDDAREWLWVRATSPETIAAIRRTFPGEWNMVEDE
jgi:hypothetical protein